MKLLDIHWEEFLAMTCRPGTPSIWCWSIHLHFEECKFLHPFQSHFHSSGLIDSISGNDQVETCVKHRMVIEVSFYTCRCQESNHLCSQCLDSTLQGHHLSIQTEPQNMLLLISTLLSPCALPMLLLACPDMRLTLFRRFLHLLPDRFTTTIERSWTGQKEMENPVLDCLAIHWAPSSCSHKSCKWIQTGKGIPTPWRPAKEPSSTDTRIFPSAIFKICLVLMAWGLVRFLLSSCTRESVGVAQETHAQ